MKNPVLLLLLLLLLLFLLLFLQVRFYAVDVDLGYATKDDFQTDAQIAASKNQNGGEVGS